MNLPPTSLRRPVVEHSRSCNSSEISNATIPRPSLLPGNSAPTVPATRSHIIIESSPSWGERSSNASASPRQQLPPSPSPDLPQVTSDIQNPTTQKVFTPGLPHPSSPTHSGSRTRPQSSGSAPTPGRPPIGVVLNVSPFKPAPGYARFDGADDLDDELVVSDVDPTRRGSRQAALLPGRDSAPATPSAPVTPAGPSTTGKRPRGRPRGWRPGMSYTRNGLLTTPGHKYLDKDGNTKVPTAPNPKSTRAKRRGRPPRQPSPTPREVWEKLVTPPPYVPCLCEWPGCKAELQNVETLRKHIRVVHGRAKPLTCRWASCASRLPVFMQDYEFHDHVDEEHLVPFVWHVGDGHRNGKPMVKQERDSDQVPAYLFGADGEQVTPWVKNQEEEDFLTRQWNRRRLRQSLMQKDADAPLEEEEDVEQILPA